MNEGRLLGNGLVLLPGPIAQSFLQFIELY